MQIGGVGNGHNHSMHQVTECVHNHDTPTKGPAAKASSQANREPMSGNRTEPQIQSSFSLYDWWRGILADGRRLLGRLWGQKTDITGDLERSVAGEAVAAVAGRQQSAHEQNPYFSAIEDTGRAKQSIWEKVKVRFHGIAGQLMGRFSGKNSFQTKQEKPKEDLRRHSKYRKDDLEIDCILTDDSYLLDSYDRKGEYSKLSTKK